MQAQQQIQVELDSLTKQLNDKKEEIDKQRKEIDSLKTPQNQSLIATNKGPSQEQQNLQTKIQRLQQQNQQKGLTKQDYVDYQSECVQQLQKVKQDLQDKVSKGKQDAEKLRQLKEKNKQFQDQLQKKQQQMNNQQVTGGEDLLMLQFIQTQDINVQAEYKAYNALYNSNLTGNELTSFQADKANETINLMVNKVFEDQTTMMESNLSILMQNEDFKDAVVAELIRLHSNQMKSVYVNASHIKKLKEKYDDCNQKMKDFMVKTIPIYGLNKDFQLQVIMRIEKIIQDNTQTIFNNRDEMEYCVADVEKDEVKFQSHVLMLKVFVELMKE